MGGMRALLGALTGSYTMAYQKYLDSDTHICSMAGKLRHQDGRTETGKWLVIGKEGADMGAAIWDEERNQIIHLPWYSSCKQVALMVRFQLQVRDGG